MDTPHPESKLSLEEQRDNVRDAIRRALSRNDTAEVERLQGHEDELEKQIRSK